MTSSAGPLIDLVESTYRLDTPKHAWLDALAAQARAALWPAGCAIVLSYKGVHTPGMRRNGASIVAHDEGLRADAVNLDPWVGPVLDTLVQGGPLAGLASKMLSDGAAAELRGHLGRFGYRDVLGLVAYSGEGHAIGLTTPVRDALPVSPAQRTRFTRLGAHIGAALRLRGRLAPRGGADGGAGDGLGAVLTPEGKVVDAWGEAAARRSSRTALSDAVLLMEKARGGLRRSDPDLALSMWRGLVRGTWSLVESIERDGRRFLMAHENGVSAPDPRALSGREQAVVALAQTGAANKAIAYALGLSVSSVGAYLAAAMRKLQLGSRAELIALARRPVAFRVGDGAGLAVIGTPVPDLTADWGAALSESERAIAEAVGKGLGNAEIGRQRGTSERTIANQMANIFRKCGVGSRAELVARMTR